MNELVEVVVFVAAIDWCFCFSFSFTLASSWRNCSLSLVSSCSLLFSAAAAASSVGASSLDIFLIRRRVRRVWVGGVYVRVLLIKSIHPSNSHICHKLTETFFFNVNNGDGNVNSKVDG